ncbi:MAG: 50S ribosomal protein L25/general stress protein Ctc [Lysobacterales bacterium]
MAEQHSIKAEGRTDQGKGASRRLRHAGKVPGIVYGGGSDPKMIQMDQLRTLRYAQNEWFFSALLELDIDGKSEQVLLRDMHRHPFKPLLMHLDFQRVKGNEAIRVRVPLHFLNEKDSPAGKTKGVVVSHNLNEIEISCLPKDLPAFIDVDLADLAMDDIIHLSDIKLPEGVEIPELKFGKEHDHAVVAAHEGREEIVVDPAAVEGAEAVAAPAAAPAKPEKKDGDKK